MIENCKFEISKENYQKTLEDGFKLSLMKFNEIDFGVIKEFLEGPFLYLEDDFLRIGMNVVQDF